ncbi:uncharacterized protein [Bemisia tabaci]|uniref:uncharacterized protein n=1 Tax=Bemisia tabaci TaxID=7038 RepID=UPI0008F9ACA0|nr:PREDICTED: uncharacterized protein LOC109030200 [Bemisia tabaci]
MAVLRITAMLLICGASSYALPAASLSSPANLNTQNSIQSRDDVFDIYSDCINKGSASCIKYKLFSFVDKILSKDSFSLTEGVTVVKTANANGFSDGAPRSLESETKSDDLESMFLNRVESFLKTHSLKVDLRGSDVLNAVNSAGRAFGDDASYDDSDAQETGRKKVKKAGKTLLPLLMLLKMKLAALIPFALGAIALIAGKALLIGKIALLLSAIIGLKKLLSHQKTVTYEIVSHPHHAPAHDHHGHESFSSSGADAGGYGGGGHGGWGRSAQGQDAQDLAYSAYKPAAAQK